MLNLKQVAADVLAYVSKTEGRKKQIQKSNLPAHLHLTQYQVIFQLFNMYKNKT